MEVSIQSIETVKPSTIHPQTQPLELNLLDQLTPMSYSPLILFYPNRQGHTDVSVSSRLKSSLSEALSVYYPLAGRVSDNCTIRDFDRGVPFVETRVNCCMSDFFNGGSDQSWLMGSLNNLLPFKTFCSVPETDAPQTGFQVNMFECGGLALGLCSSHKSHDGIVVSAFLKVWAAISMNRPDKIVAPDFVGGPLTFPATKSMLHRYVSLAKAVWFENGGNPVTRRFLFVGESIAKLRAIARGEMIEQPTRAEAVSAFLWKFIILSSKSQKHSVLTQSVDLRRVIKKNHPPLTSQSFGNLVLFSDAKYSGPHDKPIRIDHLAGLIRAGVNELVNVDYLNKGSKAIFEYYDRQAEIEDENTHVINFACWHGFGFSKTDFGWGPPVWVGLGGATGDHNASSYCSNSIVLIESGSDGIEAWVTLEEDVMSELELDPDFLLFASRNFPILRLPMHAKL